MDYKLNIGHKNNKSNSQHLYKVFLYYNYIGAAILHILTHLILITTYRQILLYSPLYRWLNWSREQFSNLPHITHVKWCSWDSTRISGSQVSIFNLVSIVLSIFWILSILFSKQFWNSIQQKCFPTPHDYTVKLEMVYLFI